MDSDPNHTEAGPPRARQDLTTGSIWRHMVNLAVPSALTNLMSYSTTFVDMIWLGRLSPKAIAAVAIYNYFWFMFALLNMVIGNGSVALMSRAYGAGDYEECRRVFGQTFMFKLIVALIVAGGGLVGQRWAFSVFGAKDDLEVLELAVAYGAVMFAATPLMFSTFTLKTGFRAIGDMKNLFYISLATMIINLVLDPFLIFTQVFIGPIPWLGMQHALVLPGLGLGIQGAAWGTVIAFAVVFVVALLYFFNGWTFLRVKPRHFLDLSWQTARKIIAIGVPPGGANFLQHIASMLIGSAIMTYGTAVFAAQGVSQILIRLIRVMIMGTNISLITLVGQNLGAKNPRRAELCQLYAYILISGLMLVVGGIFFFGAPWIARAFVPGSDAVSVATYDWVVTILRINAFVLLPFGLMQIARGAFQGSGYTRPTLIATLIGTCLIQLPIVLGGVRLMKLADPRFIWWVEAGSYAVAAVILYLVFKRGKWKTHRV
ncbi:MATE family efflux transporter [bacterium]|nr:MATE family efflux transporter [bacterium]